MIINQQLTELEMRWEQPLHDNHPTVDKVRDDMTAIISW